MKLNKTNKYLLAIWLVFILFSGCNESFLNTIPQDSYADENFYVNSETAELAVTAIYSVFAGDNFGRYWIEKGSMVEESSDTPGYMDSHLYETAYQGINDANIALERISGIDFGENDNLKKRLLAEARALRAYFYSLLHMFLGPVPMITEVLDYDEYRDLERPADVSVTRDFIKSEMLAVIPELPSRTDAVNGRVNKDFARYVLAEIYMFEKNWTEAEKALKEIIDNPYYGLLEDYELVCSYDTKLGVCNPFEYTKESIWEISLVEGVDGLSESFNDRNDPKGCSGDDYRDLYRLMRSDFLESVFIIDKQTETRIVSQDSTWVNRETGFWITTPAGGSVEVPVFVEDPRREHTVLTFGDVMECPVRPEYYVTLDRNWYGNAAEAPIMEKYWPTSSVVYAGRRGMNILLIRLGKVLLDYAEVQYRLGNEAIAYDYMNMVRERAWTGHPRPEWERKPGEILYPDAGWNQDVYPVLSGLGYDKTFIDLIQEYFLELSYEGQTSGLMMRWGPGVFYDIQEAFGATITPDQRVRVRYGYPLSEIQINPNIWQNPGFEEN
jgi:hypothetical protein